MSDFGHNRCPKSDKGSFAKLHSEDYTFNMKTIETAKNPQPVEIAPGIYWTGVRFENGLTFDWEL